MLPGAQTYTVQHPAFGRIPAKTETYIGAPPVQASEKYENLEALDRLIFSISGPRFTEDAHGEVPCELLGEAEDQQDLAAKVKKLPPQLVQKALKGIQQVKGALVVNGAPHYKEGSKKTSHAQPLVEYIDYLIGARDLPSAWSGSYTTRSSNVGYPDQQEAYQAYIQRRFEAIQSLFVDSSPRTFSLKGSSSEPPSKALKDRDISCLSSSAKVLGGLVAGSVGMATLILTSAFALEALK